MRNRTLHRRIRKWHRYLGVILGIQFLFWTAGGLYFSWTTIKTVRGDDIRKEQKFLSVPDSIASLQTCIQNFKQQHPEAAIRSIQLVNNSRGKLLYELKFHEHNQEHYVMTDAATGVQQPHLTAEDATAVALQSIKPSAIVDTVILITETDGHHEYREKPLPAYAVRLEGDVHCTVYVGKETGIVHSMRNKQWRIFDFLWMLHITDFKERDNINNWLLRILSVAGLITIASGYLLYFVSRKKKKPVTGIK
jgi:uncharacterized iron-regulated membrane protein